MDIFGFYKLLFHFFSISILFCSPHSHTIPHIPTLIPHIPTLIPHIPTPIPRIPTLIPCISTLIPRIWLLQTAVMSMVETGWKEARELSKEKMTSIRLGERTKAKKSKTVDAFTHAEGVHYKSGSF